MFILQVASSFACDGCGHHASFYNLNNDKRRTRVFGPNGRMGLDTTAARGEKREREGRAGATEGLAGLQMMFWRKLNRYKYDFNTFSRQ
jgi:hypothetical protein